MKKKWYQADSSVMTGDVSVAEGVSIWHNATLRADTAPIRIGRNRMCRIMSAYMQETGTR